MLNDARQPDASKASRLNVLLVEDHLQTAEAMLKLLESHGFAVRAVGSHREALKMASQWMPDVLISDIGLPGKDDGIEVMKWMRTAYPKVRGICVSGFAAAEDVERSREAGFAEFLTKPITMGHLVAAIERLSGPSQ